MVVQSLAQRHRIATFAAIALVGPTVAALVLRAFTTSLSPLASTLVVVLAMPAPLVAALVVGPRPARDALRRAVATGFRRPGATIGLAMAGASAWLVSAVALALAAANGLGVAGVGALSSDPGVMRQRLSEEVGTTLAATADLPELSLPLVVGLAAVAGLVAGLTLNGLLAFGEEYGWRGVLWEHLRPHGRLATIGLVGVLWGLWHAPLVLLVGFNYPEHRVAGVGAMVLFTVATSWPLDVLRRATGSPVAPAIMHGAINGMAGVLVLVTGGSRLLAPPVGVLGAVAMLPAGALLHVASTRMARRSPDDDC